MAGFHEKILTLAAQFPATGIFLGVSRNHDAYCSFKEISVKLILVFKTNFHRLTVLNALALLSKI